ncbi:hypothetical protein [Paraburkholderia phytofirmans]|uniref:hypothetical protein n=1 Tax=Paraburkholderia phytofirmans TaxID=261302 RepID=UPI0038BDB9ED
MKAIPQDKCLHVILGVLIFAVADLVNWQVGIALVAVAGILKEVLDHFTGGDVSVWDVVATLTGGLIGLVCFAR